MRKFKLSILLFLSFYSCYEEPVGYIGLIDPDGPKVEVISPVNNYFIIYARDI